MALLVLALAAAAAAVYLLGELVTLGARERDTSVRRAATYGKTAKALVLGGESLRERALVPLKEKMARTVLRLNPRSSIDQVTLRLLSAGVSRKISPTSFLASKGAMAVGGVGFGAMVGGASGNGLLAVMLAAMLGGFGFIAPDLLLSARIRKRRDQIMAQMPDGLDLLAVSVEAGLGFDAAIAKLTEQMEGPLSEEFTLMLSEMRVGESRIDALKKLGQRVETPEMAAFVRAIIQADQFGISLGRILRVQATDTRLRRQAAAEERAAKAPIKMLFPTVCFIFPAMFLVILGPAFLNIVKVL